VILKMEHKKKTIIINKNFRIIENISD